MGRTACTEPECLYKGAFYFTHLILRRLVKLVKFGPVGSDCFKKFLCVCVCCVRATERNILYLTQKGLIIYINEYVAMMECRN